MSKKITLPKKFLLFFLALMLLPALSFAAEGDLAWENATDLGPGTEKAYGVAVDSTGIYASGFQADESIWRVEKRNLNTGALIWEQAVDLTAGTDISTEIAVDSTGVYAVGHQNDADLWRVEKRNLNTGALIWQRAVNLSAGTDLARAAAIDSTGIYIVGGQDTSELWRVEKRNLNTGALIWQRTVNLTPSLDFPGETIVGPTGVYTVGGQASASLSYYDWRVEKRSLADGSLIWEKVEAYGSSAFARGVAVSTTGVYTTGGQNDIQSWRVEKRNLDNGDLIWEYVKDYSSGEDRVHQIDFFDNGLYIVGGQDDMAFWRVERRLKVPEGAPNCFSLVAVPDEAAGPFASALTADFADAEGVSINFDCDGDSVTDGTSTVSGGLASYVCNYGAVAANTVYTASASEPVNGSFCTTEVTNAFCDNTCNGTCSDPLCTPAQDPDCDPNGCCGDGIVQQPNGNSVNEECDEGGLGGITQISTCQELQDIRNGLSEDYALMRDIDCSMTTTWNEDPGNPGTYFGFEPIDYFKGVFDGRGFKITGLNINRPTESVIGLFGYDCDCDIKNVGLVNVNIVGDDKVGGLIGGDSQSKANIDNSYIAGNITGASDVGGLVGYSDDIGIYNSYSRGSVTGTNYVGGLVGQSDDVINWSYSTASVTGTGWSIGALVGSYSGTCSNSLWNPTDASPAADSDCGTEATQAEMKLQNTFESQGWDFTSIWAIDGSTNDGYPFYHRIGLACLPAESCAACQCISPPVPSCSSLTAVPNQAIGPFASTLTANFVNVADGTSIDFDCGLGPIDFSLISGGVASYVCNYGAVAGVTNYTVSATEPVSGASCTTNVTVNPPDAVCDMASGDECEVDGDCGVGEVCSAFPDCACSVVVPSGPVEFQIVSFDLSESFVSVEIGSSVPVDAVVVIRNIGGGVGDATLEIVVKDKTGVVMATDSVPSPNLAGGVSDEHIIVFDVPDSWDPGIYNFYATVYDNADGLPDDQKLKTLTLALTKSTAVPELGIVFIPLLAFSILAILFFAERKKN